MINIVFSEGCYVPLVFCDACKKRIKRAGDGNAVWKTLEDGSDRQAVYHVHKGRCDEALAASLGEAFLPWDPLGVHLTNVCRNVFVDEDDTEWCDKFTEVVPVPANL